MTPQNWSRFRLWVGRLALIPLVVYSTGTLLEVLTKGEGTLRPDWLMSYEAVGLLLSASLVLWALGR